MIKNTHEKTPQYTISAYSDNAAVFEGHEGYVWTQILRQNNGNLLKKKFKL